LRPREDDVELVFEQSTHMLALPDRRHVIPCAERWGALRGFEWERVMRMDCRGSSKCAVEGEESLCFGNSLLG
jgi:hypothetical protein